MAAPIYQRRSHVVRAPQPDTEHASRSPVAKDRDRIIHSGALRRLQRKSQIVGVQSNDFFRTRLTHTLECAQIGRGIAQRSLKSDLSGVVERQAHLPDLIEAACLAHDLGHPPFGHNGEAALQAMMRRHAGGLFEGNAQSLRIVTQLEPKVYVERAYGLDLCATTLRAIVKYPVFENSAGLDPGHPKFCFYDSEEDRQLVEWLYGGRKPERTLATEILEIADDIAYAVHDFEDGVWSGLIPLWALVRDEDDAREQVARRISERGDGKYFKGSATVEATLRRLLRPLEHVAWARVPFDRASASSAAGLKNYCAGLIGNFIGEVTANDQFVNPPPRLRREIAVLKAMAWEWLIAATEQETVRFGQRRLVEDLFEGYWANPAMLEAQSRWKEVSAASGHSKLDPRQHMVWPDKARLICDEVAGMTDLYALHVHAEMHQGGGAPSLRLL
jgi:dGTPase